MGRKIDITGMKFGRLLVLHESDKKGSCVKWVCLCSCGKKITVERCAQIIHADFRNALDRLKPHVVCFCEMPERHAIYEAGIYDYDMDMLNNYVVTGYTRGGSDESAGVTIVAQKLLQSGKVLNLVTPFIQFSDADAYEFAGELSAEIEACDYEATEYLFSEKWGVKQLSLDFDTPDDISVEVITEKPKKRGRKKKIEKTELNQAI